MNGLGQLIYRVIDYWWVILPLAMAAPFVAAVAGADRRVRWAARLIVPGVVLASGAAAIASIAARTPPPGEIDAGGMALVVTLGLTVFALAVTLALGELGRLLGRALGRRR